LGDVNLRHCQSHRRADVRVRKKACLPCAENKFFEMRNGGGQSQGNGCVVASVRPHSARNAAASARRFVWSSTAASGAAVSVVGPARAPNFLRRRSNASRSGASASATLPLASNACPSPESAVASGTAFFLSGPRAGHHVPFTLDLHSTFFPDQTTVFDMARLSFCSGSSSCGGYSFFGELHHEPQ